MRADRFIVLALSTLILAGCTAQAARTGGVGVDQSQAQAASEPETPKLTLSASLSKDRRARDPLNPARRALDMTPDGLKGFGPRALIRLLGEPDLVRTDFPAEVWQYKTKSCILDLFLYNEATEPKVSYVTARATGLLKTSAQACLDKVRAVESGGAPSTRTRGST